MKHSKYIFATLLIFGLGACATSMDKQACAQANWQEIGRQDGADGRERNVLEHRTHACERHDMFVSKTAWEAGYRLGLMKYCRPAHAYAQGRKGRALKEVCPASLQNDLEKQHDRGMQHYMNQQRTINFLDHKLKPRTALKSS